MAANIGNITGSSISGDGVAAGIGNRVHVDKSRNTHYHGGGGGGGKNDTGPGAALGFVGLMAFVLACAAFFFARYAHQVYGVELAIAAAEAGFVLLSFGLAIRSQQINGQNWRQAAAFGLALVSALATSQAWAAYPQELVDIAQASPSVRTFWCGVNATGHMLALQHMLGALVMGFSLLILLPQSLVFAAPQLLDPTSRIYGLLNRLSGWGSLLIAAVGIAGAWALLNYAGSYLYSAGSDMGSLICNGLHR